MSLPHFDPWSKISSPVGRAYRAYCAYSEAKLGAPGTIGTGAGTKPCGQFDDGLRGWLTLLEAARARARDRGLLTSPNGRLVIAAIDVCRGAWAKTLITLGWHESEIFAMAAESGQIGGIVQQLNGRRIRFATAHYAYIETGSGTHVYVRGHSGLDALPRIWNLPFDEGTG